MSTFYVVCNVLDKIPVKSPAMTTLENAWALLRATKEELSMFEYWIMECLEDGSVKIHKEREVN